MSDPTSYLRALRTFEVVARLLSFTRAAEELHVTQAAVSHQIKLLESVLETQLFRRLTRKVELTPSGRLLFETLTQAFHSIESTVARIQASQQGQDTLTVALTPAFSALWLVPRLNRFWVQHPEIELKLHHTLYHRSHHKEEAQVSIRWGDGSWKGMVVELLLSVDLVPICAPALLARRPLAEARDLAGWVLLHEDTHDDWRRWLEVAGGDPELAERGPLIDDFVALLMAVQDEQGVALGRTALVEGDLRGGRLVAPFPVTIRADGAYYLVHDPNVADHRALAAFKAFVHDEARSNLGGLRDDATARTPRGR